MTTATIYIERNGIDDIPVLVTGTYHKGFRGTYEQPPEQAYVELTGAELVVAIKDAPDFALTPAETERAEEALYEAAMDDQESDAEAAAEARARRLEDE